MQLTLEGGIMETRACFIPKNLGGLQRKIERIGYEVFPTKHKLIVDEEIPTGSGYKMERRAWCYPDKVEFCNGANDPDFVGLLETEYRIPVDGRKVYGYVKAPPSELLKGLLRVNTSVFRIDDPIYNELVRIYDSPTAFYDPVAERLAKKYLLRDVSHRDGLTHLITAVNNDEDLGAFLVKADSLNLLREVSWLPGGFWAHGRNLNYSKDLRLHLHVFSDYTSEDIPVRKAADITWVYPLTAEDFRTVVAARVMQADKKLVRRKIREHRRKQVN